MQSVTVLGSQDLISFVLQTRRSSKMSALEKVQNSFTLIQIIPLSSSRWPIVFKIFKIFKMFKVLLPIISLSSAPGPIVFKRAAKVVKRIFLQLCGFIQGERTLRWVEDIFSLWRILKTTDWMWQEEWWWEHLSQVFLLTSAFFCVKDKILRYESSTLILYKELSSSIFQSCQSVSQSVIGNTCPDLHFVQYIKA